MTPSYNRRLKARLMWLCPIHMDILVTWSLGRVWEMPLKSTWYVLTVHYRKPATRLTKLMIQYDFCNQINGGRKSYVKYYENQNYTIDERQTMELHCEHHDAFSLEENERGETDLTEVEIVTGDAAPKRVPARRMPLVVRQEVAR